MFQFFPFSNAHQLNLDWILETLKTFPRTVNNTYPDEEGNINLPTVAGVSSWNGIGADGFGNVNPLETVADLDNAAEGLHFYRWENPDTSNNPFGAAENTGYMTGNGEGVCISYKSANGCVVQLASNAGDYTHAIRCKEAGDPWTVWRYLMGTIDISNDIILDSTNMDLDLPFSKFAYIQNNWCFGYVQGQVTGILSGNMLIASGLPTPLCDPIPYQFIGMLELLPSAELLPCKFMINPDGTLTFSYIGNTEEAGDVIVVQFAYPVK